MRIGVDIGGTNLVAGLTDAQFQIVDKLSTPTLGKRAEKKIVDDIIRLILTLMEKHNLTEKDIESIGLGVPGWCNTDTGIILECDNVNFRNTPIAKLLQAVVNVPVFLANDADCAALGEAYGGATKDVDHSIMVTIGTGVGGGIIIDKKIYNGFNHGGGEVGHMVIDMHGLPCVCGRRGCWEQYASATALIAQTKDAAKANPDSILYKSIGGDLEKINGKTAFDALAQGCPVAENVVDNFARYLACGIVNLISIFQPEMVVLGGGVSKAGAPLLSRVQAILDKECYGDVTSLPRAKFCVATLGNDAGVIGAAALGV